MAEDSAEARSGRSRFLSKSKWGKVFKENDSPPAPGKVNSFKLNEDVVDFLKPSTEKGTRPKINIAVAQRWPEAHEVRRASEANAHNASQNFTKPKRRKGLTVGFVKTAPEIIGEGGDDALDPPSEVSRKKSAMPRSVSARQPGALEDGTPWPGTQAQRQPTRQARAPSMVPEEDFRPAPVRRVQTSQHEFSAPLQRKHAPPPWEELPPHRPSISRTPTGFGTLDEQHMTAYDTPVDDDEHSTGRTRPALQTSFDQSKDESPFDSAVSGISNGRGHAPIPREPPSPAMRKQRDQRENEGMALRRASALYMNDENEEVRRLASGGVQPPSDFYNALSEPTATNIISEPVRPSRETLSPEDGPSPFADPKYIKRHSGEMAPASQKPSGTQPAKQPGQSNQFGHKRATSSVSSVSQSVPQAQHQLHNDIAMRPNHGFDQPNHAQPRPFTQQDSRQRPIEDLPDHVRATQSLAGYTMPTGAPRQPSPNISVPHDTSESRSRSRSPMRDRIFNAQVVPEKQRPAHALQTHSSGSINHFSPSPDYAHARNASQSNSPQRREPTFPSQAKAHTESPHRSSPRTSLLAPGNLTRPSLSPNPYNQESSPADYFSAPRMGQPGPARSPAANLRLDEAGRPGSSGSARPVHRPAASPQPLAQADPAADAAFQDFAARVAHMKGVFRLTAEKERPATRCSALAWSRAGLWWYLRGKAGLEMMLQQRPRSPEKSHQELLAQPHVDLAKAWWILSDPLEPYDSLNGTSPQSAQPGDSPDVIMQRAVTMLRSYLKSLSLQMVRNQLMPPHQSLIQGQDTRIWLEYPRFSSDAASVLSGAASSSLLADPSTQIVDPLNAFPLGDSRSVFCYGRFPVEVSVSTDDAETDRIVFTCLLSMLRNTRDFLPTIVLSSQNEVLNTRIGPRQPNDKGLTWQDVSWKTSSQAFVVEMPRGFNLTVRMHEKDFRTLWNFVEYARKLEQSLHPEADEKLVHEARLAELQYSDSSGSRSFPQEKVRGCMALVYQKTIEYRDASSVRKMHNCYRLLLVTDPGHKSLSTVSHELCKRVPLFFEFITDAAAGGTTAMVIRVREESRQCRILLVFSDVSARQALYDVLNGLTVGSDESIVGKMTVTGVNIQAASQTEGFMPIGNPALQDLQWQKLGVTNGISYDPNTRIPETVESENLRIVARHAAGCITDRLNLGKGELLLRVPCADTAIPTIQLLRGPQQDMTMSIDTRASPPHVCDGIADLLNLAQREPTIRTFTFATSADLFAFQAAVTGFAVTYDGVASSFGISRRMMVVSIHHKLQASKVRLQVVVRSSIVQVLAFMEDFSHADAMCFQVKSTDTFESVKGDGKSKKWAVKMKDAKFSLPRKEKSEVDGDARVRRRFVNLEGLDYAEEHDDITIGFDTEKDRDRFAQALPAATTVGRMITLKRRI